MAVMPKAAAASSSKRSETARSNMNGVFVLTGSSTAGGLVSTRLINAAPDAGSAHPDVAGRRATTIGTSGAASAAGSHIADQTMVRTGPADADPALGADAVDKTAPARLTATVAVPQSDLARSAGSVNLLSTTPVSKGAVTAGSEAAGDATLPTAVSDTTAMAGPKLSTAAVGVPRRRAPQDSDAVRQHRVNSATAVDAAIVEPHVADPAEESSAGGAAAVEQPAVTAVVQQSQPQIQPQTLADGSGSALVGDSAAVSGSDSDGSIAAEGVDRATGDIEVVEDPDPAAAAASKQGPVGTPLSDGNRIAEQPIVLGTVSIGDDKDDSESEGASQRRFQQEQEQRLIAQLDA